MIATVKKVTQETPRVYSVVVTLPQPIAFKTGQVMRWNAPGSKAGRLFSIAVPGGDQVSELSFVISILPEGIVSSRVPLLKPGDTVDLAGPHGKFIFDETDPRDIGLIAGGTGISVLRSIYLHVLTHGLPNKVRLLFSVRNRDEVIFRDELAALAKKYPQFTYTITLTREQPEQWKGKCGTINAAMLAEEFGKEKFQQAFYLCGPKTFVKNAENILSAAGVTPDRIHIDRWVF
ncbi:MAG: hypothetical protein HY422_01955 [Candidatus Komeilibacteria bacterium]|nr:hypothetical protein [Candidatus Komeilibacteria bacterium]